MLPRRPKPGETEEDLLLYQEEFLAKQGETSAKIVKKGDKRKAVGDAGDVAKPTLKRDVVTLGGGLPTEKPDDDIPKKKSKFKSQGKAGKKSGVSGLRGERVHIDLDNDEDMQEAMDRHDAHVTSVLSDIMERDTRNVPVYLPRSMQQAFPTAFHRGSVGDTFCQISASSFGVTGQMKPVMEIDQTIPKDTLQKDVVSMEMDTSEDMEVEVTEFSKPPTLPAVSHKGIGNEEAMKIHQENLAKMADMSEQEILAEQAKLQSMLDPKLVEFLTSRSKKATTTDIHTEVKTENTKQEIESGDTAMVTESPVEEAKQAQQEVKMPLEPKKEWVNMDTVEKEKMEWMQEVPKPKPGEKKIGIQARFDLQGHVISRDADVPMREGLHHHGEEPEAPGYTLEELFHLSRSAAMNQRVISLQTLAKVIYNYRIDNLGGRLGAPLIPRLIDAGLVFILRWSLDDSSEAGIAAAVDGFKSLLVQPADEECLDKVFPWYRGHEMHPMVPTENDDEDDEDDPEDKNDKNKHETELLEQDIIKGLLKMKFLERIRYILEVCRPAPTVVVNIIQVLTRIARHSPESCHEIMKCPRLMNTLFSSFLPTTWKPTDGSVMENIYGYPVRPVLKLIRVICSAGRNMAAILLTKYNLMSVIVRYTTQDPTDMQLQIGEAYMLSVEAFYTWKVCISYGLASNSISELYPVLMQHLQLFQRLSVLPRPASEGKSTQALYELQLMRSAAVVGLLEMAVHVGATVADLQSQQSMRPQEDEKNRIPTNPVH
ncbi:RNA polymerase II-associated protein 1-like [Ptychodera flava]|uniref:RNA polymerase II-associated protein 1-like n=1 Tax=Ptychodera flava TaxID=63121 RepID=UPI003969CC7A